MHISLWIKNEKIIDRKEKNSMSNENKSANRMGTVLYSAQAAQHSKTNTYTMGS